MSSLSELSGRNLLQSYVNYENANPYNRINLRVLIPHIHTGLIIGSQGKTIQKISAFYHVVLNFTKIRSRRRFMRLFQLRGKADDCASACTNCFEMLIQSYNDPVQNGMDFVLPDAFIQYLQEGGKNENGENIFQEIAFQTNTEIKIMSSFLPNSTERILRISIPGGNSHIQNFYLAVKLLTKQLDENFTIAMCAPDNKFYQQEEESDLVYTDTQPPPDNRQEIYN